MSEEKIDWSLIPDHPEKSNTPETDAAWAAWQYAGPAVHVNFARKLERERDEARKRVEVEVTRGEQWCREFIEMRKERDELRARLAKSDAMLDWIQENWTDTEFISDGEFGEGMLRDEIELRMKEPKTGE